MLESWKMISITRRLDALRAEHPSVEDAIKEAEGRFRDEELEQDWSSQPIENDSAGGGEPISPLPPCWIAARDCAALIAIAYAAAQARTDSDPAKFEQFTEDAVAAVAQDIFFSKLTEYARNPHQVSSLVIDQFTADVRTAAKKAMKALQRDVWKRPRTAAAGRLRHSVQSQIEAAESGAPKPPAKERKNAPRRKPLPNVAELVAGRDYISPEHATEWFGASPRNLRKLAEMGRIETRGEGQKKQISVVSLRRYFGV
jgi:hypothetical protein